MCKTIAQDKALAPLQPFGLRNLRLGSPNSVYFSTIFQSLRVGAYPTTAAVVSGEAG
jgi:hypothetical protein